MTTLTVNIGDKKSEKAVLDALGLNYEVASESKTVPEFERAAKRILENIME